MKVSYDETTSRLSYTLSVGEMTADRLTAVWIHLGTPDKPGAARHQLFGSGQPAEGVVTLGAVDRKAIADRRLMVRFFPRTGPVRDVPILAW